MSKHELGRDRPARLHFGGEFGEPVRVRDRVVVQEHDEPPAGEGETGIVAAREPRVPRKSHHPGPRMLPTNELDRTVGGSVVDDDDFEAMAGIGLSRQRRQARPQVPRPVVVHDQNAQEGRIHETLTRLF